MAFENIGNVTTHCLVFSVGVDRLVFLTKNARFLITYNNAVRHSTIITCLVTD